MMLVRGAAAAMHNRDRLMSVAFDGVGSLPMATIDKFRDLKQVGGGIDMSLISLILMVYGTFFLRLRV